MHVLLICNKKENLGDYNQVSAVAKLLAQEFPDVGSQSQITEIQVKPRERTKLLFAFFLKIHFWRYVGPSGRWAWLWKQLFTSQTDIGKLKPDVIVARLQSSEHAAAALKHWYSIPAFFVGEPENLDPTCFDLVFTTRDEPKFPNQVLLETAPSHLTVPGYVGEQVPAIEAANGPIWTFLIGGAKPCFPFSAEDVRHWIEFILKAHKEEGVRWCISTSRRTDPWMEEMMRSALDGTPAILDATWWSELPRETLATYIKHADLCFVTAESQSMISDCIALMTPVVGITALKAAEVAFDEGELRDAARITKFNSAKIRSGQLVTADSAQLYSAKSTELIIRKLQPISPNRTWSKLLITDVSKHIRKLKPA